MEASRQTQLTASLVGEQTLNGGANASMLKEDSIAEPSHLSMASMNREEPNFPVNPLMSKHLSQQ